MYLQNVDNMFDLKWATDVTYGQVRKPWEVEYSTYQLRAARTPSSRSALFDTYEKECKRLLAAGLVACPPTSSA